MVVGGGWVGEVVWVDLGLVGGGSVCWPDAVGWALHGAAGGGVGDCGYGCGSVGYLCTFVFVEASGGVGAGGYGVVWDYLH
ncbi:MAG: hypothetical protein ACFFD8_01535 [Candidatus Thorarchaeota archaeon]